MGKLKCSYCGERTFVVSRERLEEEGVLDVVAELVFAKQEKAPLPRAGDDMDRMAGMGFDERAQRAENQERNRRRRREAA